MTKRELEQMVKTRVEENQRLLQRIIDLERELAKARKTSTTSSKLPSSDMVKPPKASPPPLERFSEPVLHIFWEHLARTLQGRIEDMTISGLFLLTVTFCATTLHLSYRRKIDDEFVDAVQA